MKLCGAVAIAIVINFIINCVLRIKSNIEEGLEQLYFKNSKTEKIIEERLNEIENNIMTEMACLAAKIDNDIKDIKYEPFTEKTDKSKELLVDQLIKENERLKEENSKLKQSSLRIYQKYLKLIYPHRFGSDVSNFEW